MAEFHDHRFTLSVYSINCWSNCKWLAILFLKIQTSRKVVRFKQN